VKELSPFGKHRIFSLASTGESSNQCWKSQYAVAKTPADNHGFDTSGVTQHSISIIEITLDKSKSICEKKWAVTKNILRFEAKQELR
jgi:hypothetical protein